MANNPYIWISELLAFIGKTETTQKTEIKR